MKTAKEKAKQLVVQYYGHTITAQKAIDCAIIAVEHCRDQVERIADVHVIEYWREVREILDKMEGDLK